MTTVKDATGRCCSEHLRPLRREMDTYGDRAGLIGTHHVPVGVYLATRPVSGPWRVLMVYGWLSPGFRWLDGRQDDPHELLAK